MAKQKTGAELRRATIRKEFFSRDDLWTGEKESGWFPIPRTMPLVLSLIDSKPISEGKNASYVYLELLSRMRSEGVIEMGTEAQHAYAAGYAGTRGVRSWQERMKILVKNGFIRVEKSGNEPYKFVALIHPVAVVQKLRDEGKVPDEWWSAYIARKLDTKELSQAQRLQKQADAPNVIPFSTPFQIPNPFQVPAPPPPATAAAPAAPSSPPSATGTGKP